MDLTKLPPGFVLWKGAPKDAIRGVLAQVARAKPLPSPAVQVAPALKSVPPVPPRAEPMPAATAAALVAPVPDKA